MSFKQSSINPPTMSLPDSAADKQRTFTAPVLKPLTLGGVGLGHNSTSATSDKSVTSRLQSPKLSFTLDNSPAHQPAVQDWIPANTPLQLVQRLNETEDAVSFTFSTVGNARFAFKAGQFVTLAVTIADKTHYRAYSISSIPGQQQLRLTIKRVPGGLVSNWLVDNLQVGDSLSAINIAGEFNSQDCSHKAKLLFISAGCGITPVMSMAKTLLSQDTDNTESEQDIAFLHCTRDKHNIIFANEMVEMTAAHSQFKVQLLLEEHVNTQLPSLPGRISAETLLQCYPDLHQRTIFLCGPVGFMQAVQQMIAASDFDMTHFFQESFTPAAESNQAGALSTTDNTSTTAAVKLYVPDFAVEAEVAAGDSLLDALEAHGVPIIGACRAGVCGSCKCKVNKGGVTSTSTATLTEDEIAQGYVLACSSTLTADVEVSL